MPPLPPEFYVPAFGALLGALAWVSGAALKVASELWRRNQIISDRLYEMAGQSVSAIDASTVAIREATAVMEAIYADQSVAVANDAHERPDAHARHPRRSDRRSGSD